MAAFTKTTPGAPTGGFYSAGDTITDSLGVIYDVIQTGQAGPVGYPGGSSSAQFAARPLRTAKILRGEGAPTSDATVGARTYTAAEVLGGIIVRDPNGASRSDVLPTAALLVAAVTALGRGGAQVGDIIEVLIINGADAAETITLGGGTGGTFDANQQAVSRIIAQNSSKLVRIRLTNVTLTTEAYVVYS